MNFKVFFAIVCLLALSSVASAFHSDLNASPITVNENDNVTVWAAVTKSPSEAVNSVDLNVSDAAGNSYLVTGECTPVFQDKAYHVEERISNDLQLVSAKVDSIDYPYNLVGVGEDNVYTFTGIPIDGNSSATLLMVFKNNSGEPLQGQASINTKFAEEGQDCNGALCEFELFIFKANVPAIPEFASILLPMLAVLGIAFFAVRK